MVVLILSGLVVDWQCWWWFLKKLAMVGGVGGGGCHGNSYLVWE